MKKYNIYGAGSTKQGTIRATCISKAAKAFISSLGKEAKYTLNGKTHAQIRCMDNHTIVSDFVIFEAL